MYKRAMMSLDSLTWACDSKIWPSDLVFYLVLDLTWPIFILVLEIVNANILTKFNEYLSENEVFRAYTKFF